VLTNLYPYIQDSDNPSINFSLAQEYDALGQTASALGFYLRCAERSQDPLQQYTALLHCALCFERQRCRDGTEKTLLQKAIALMPRRPEAYFLLSRLHEILKEWQECYTTACIGMEICDINIKPIEDVEYPGNYALLFQKGVAAWWVGHTEECREIMEELKFHYNLKEEFAQAVNNNLTNLGYPTTTIKYTGSMSSQLKYRFDSADTVKQNYSQSLQDIFVLSMLNGKRNGTYVEIGSAEPFYNNNTALLETEFDWSGISVDIDRNKVEDFIHQRNNIAFCLDATKIDYLKIFKSVGLEKSIDYLQIDCDPPEISFDILQQIPFNQYRFAVITFEHDFYYDKVIRDQSREFLKSKGYVLVVGDIAYNKKNSYEDWWCYPELIDPDILSQLVDHSDSVKYARDYLIKNL
jgi:hypothetical protein